MCCSTGGTRERLEKIDLESFGLRDEELTEQNIIRAIFIELRGIVSSAESRWSGDGKIAATLSSVHYTKLKKMSDLIWNLHRSFSEYMNSDSDA